MGTYTYTTDGGTLTHTGTVGSPLQYGGGYADSETALIYLQARYYDPATGQFLTVDAALTATAAPYGYVNGNYTNLIDPLGLWGWNPADWTAGNWATVGLVAGGIALAATGVGVAVDLEVIGDFAAADLVGGIGYGAGALATATDAVPCGLVEGVAALVLAQGSTSVDQLASHLAGDVEVHLIGDALAPRTVEEAILEGLVVGESLLVAGSVSL